MSLQTATQGLEHIQILSKELTQYQAISDQMTPEEKEAFKAQYEAAAEEIRKTQSGQGKTA